MNDKTMDEFEAQLQSMADRLIAEDAPYSSGIGWALSAAEQAKQVKQLQQMQAQKQQLANMKAKTNQYKGMYTGNITLSGMASPLAAAHIEEPETSERDLLYKILSAQGMLLTELADLRAEIDKLKK